MYIEERYIYNQFTDNFLKSKTGSIVLYGTGLNSQRLLEKVDGARIAGLMDEKKTGQVLWGHKVLSYPEVAGIKGCMIVIIARNAVINVIYRRIENFCLENGIPVYDIHGKDLRKKQGQAGEACCFGKREGELREMIAGHDIISFDIFDTLLMRRVLRPRDIFSLMDQALPGLPYKFSEERIRAEDSFEAGSNPDIYGIYGRFRENTGSSEKEVGKFMELEADTEKESLVRRQELCEIYDWALQKGKEVYIVSDMYFPRMVLEGILDSFGIRGYQDIFISCEYGLAKQEGLFGKYKASVMDKRNGEGGVSFLHIGDNYFSDIVAAQDAGIDAYQVFSAQEMLEYSIYAKALQCCKTLEENIVLSCFAQKAYHNPFRACGADGKLILGSMEEAAGLFIAPIICKYVIWLIQNLKEEHCDVVLFPSRDGYIIKNIYDKIKGNNPQMDLPDSLYLYTSRRSAMVAAAETEADIQEIMDFVFVKGKAELLKERFGIDNPEGGSVPNSVLLSLCKEEQGYYKKYLDQLGLGKYHKAAFMDFVAMGTVQAALEQITGKKLEGFYFLRRRADKKKLENLRCHSLYQAAGDFQIRDNVYTYYYLLETIITSYEPTFWGMDGNGRKRFYGEKRGKETMELLEGIHNEIYKYCDMLLSLLPDVHKADSGVGLYDSLLGFFSSDYSVIQDDGIGKLVNWDEFMGKEVTELNR